MNLPKHLLPTTVVGSYPQPDWLVDRAMMGWDITVLIAQPRQDFRPLHILGVRTLAFDSVLDSRMRLPICDGIAVAADLYFGDSRLRRRHVQPSWHHHADSLYLQQQLRIHQRRRLSDPGQHNHAD